MALVIKCHFNMMSVITVSLKYGVHVVRECHYKSHFNMLHGIMESLQYGACNYSAITIRCM